MVNADVEKIVEWGRSVIQVESDALNNTADLLDENFAHAVSIMRDVSGKVVVTGLGKSGHVGRKISATFASTGTPSFFLHPAEALHGDLGMMGDGDCLLAIAFGGETSETVEVAKYARRIGSKVIVLTGKTSSSLANLADVVLDGSVKSEACPHNLAPTCSTTVAMVLGDAIAVSLMRSRGFEANEFANYHPGGSLGRKLSLVKDHARSMPTSLSLDDEFKTVLDVVTTNNYGIAAVFGYKGELIGAISDGDLRRGMLSRREEVFSTKASDFVSGYPHVISYTALAVDAVVYMEKHSISSLFVVGKTDEVLGLVRMYDLLAAKIV